jgi:hypothetical protein
MTSSNRSVRQLRVTDNPTDITGRFSKDKAISYRFKLNRSQDVHLTLSQLATNANVDVQLLNQKNRVVGKSSQAGAASEFISTTLKRGEYSVRLLNKRSAVKTGFRLKIATVDALPTLQAQSLQIGRGQEFRLTSAQLKAFDGLQANDQLRYTLTQMPQYGVLHLNGVPLGIGGSFTQADVDKGWVTYKNTSPGVISMGNGSNPMVSGFNLVWAAPGGADGGSDNEIFFYDGKTTRQLSQNSAEDIVKAIDGNHARSRYL